MAKIPATRLTVLSALLTAVAWTQPSADPPRFSMADVHSVATGSNTFARGGLYRGGRYELHNATMVDLVRVAYGVDADKVLDGPPWARKSLFDVIASTPPATTPESLKTMLQSLLAERFNLMVHRETRPVAAYLITAGSQPVLKKADGTGETGCKVVSNVAANAAPIPGVNIVRANLNGNAVSLNLNQPIPFECRNMTIAEFADGLRTMIGSQAYIHNTQVVDQTGLAGKWNFDIKWTLPQGGPAAASNASSVVTMFDAFDKQLGLKLELGKAPFPVIAIDSANETPTANLSGISEKLAPSAGFEVVDLKPGLPISNAGPAGGGGRGGMLFQGAGRVTMQGQTLKALIATAWNLTGPDQVKGGPQSAETALYDFDALAPTPELMPGFPPVGPVMMDTDSTKAMLQALLKERFKLTVHQEAGSVPGYEMVAVKPTLKKANPAGTAGCFEGPAPGDKDPRADNPAATRLLTCLNTSVAEFTAELKNRASGYLGQLPAPVDSTGIQGKYDITLNFSAAGMSGPTAITLFDALEKQLGLKLQMGKRTGNVLVIDHCEDTPIDN